MFAEGKQSSRLLKTFGIGLEISFLPSPHVWLSTTVILMMLQASALRRPRSARDMVLLFFSDRDVLLLLVHFVDSMTESD